jgi:hypothetical protein
MTATAITSLGEVTEKAKRRAFTAEYKRPIVFSRANGKAQTIVTRTSLPAHAARAACASPRTHRAALEPRGQALAVEILHHEVVAPDGKLIEGEDVDDVRMADLVDGVCLLLEARIRSGYCAACGASTLIATRLPISGCVPRRRRPSRLRRGGG